MQRTPIEWTHWSANALKLELPDGSRVNACVKISPGCVACYAEAMVRRFWRKAWGKFPGYSAALFKIGKPVLVEEELRAVLKLSQRIADGKADPAINQIFWHDMTDEFLAFWPDELLDRIWAVRALTPNLIHQVLTKRAERMHELLTGRLAFGAELPHVWWGVSVENRQHGLPRVEWLRRTPGALRFLSVEPLLEDLGEINLEGIGWVIVGGESGHGARPMQAEWVHTLRQQCEAAGVPFFFKQWGGVRKSRNGRLLEGRTYDETPERLRREMPGRAVRMEMVREVSEWGINSPGPAQ